MPLATHPHNKGDIYHTHVNEKLVEESKGFTRLLLYFNDMSQIRFISMENKLKDKVSYKSERKYFLSKGTTRLAGAVPQPS